MKRKADRGGDKPVISESVREEDAVAVLVTVITLCNMVFVNCAATRLPGAVVQSDCCSDYQHILCNSTLDWCFTAQRQILFSFGDLSQCFPSNAHLKKKIYIL